MGKLKILHVIDHLGEGGSQELMVEIMRLASPQFSFGVVGLFKPHGSFGHEEKILALGIPVYVLRRGRAIHSPKKVLEGAFLFFRLVGRCISFFPLLIAFYRVVQKERPHVIHAHFLFAYPVSIIVGGLTKIPVVFTIPALQSQMDSYSRLIFPMYRFLAPFVAHFFTALPGDKPDEKLHIAKSKVTAFLGVVDLECVKRIPREANPLLGEFSLDKNSKIILSIGRFDPEKGHEFTVRAFRVVQRMIPGVQLIILGEGPTKNWCLQFAENEGFSKKVIMPGFRKDSENFFSLADLFVRAYLYEGMNTSLQWAMAYRKPIIAFDNHSPSEILESGTSALFVPLKDSEALSGAIIRMLQNTEEAKRLGEGARLIMEGRANIRKSIEIFQTEYKRLAHRE